MRLSASVSGIILLLIFSGCTPGGSFKNAVVKDSDWNTRFTSNCALPDQKSIQWIYGDRRFLRFTLNNHDKGGCDTDKIARHSAPYWERAELKQLGLLEKDTTYSINASIRFVEGFSGDRETFLQIHAYNKDCKQAYPPVMLKFDNALSKPAALTLFTLQNSGQHLRHQSDVLIDEVLGDWVDLSLKLDTGNRKVVSLLLNGNALFTELPYWVESCGKLHVKFGAYRPGSDSGNKKSVVDFDSITVKEM